MWAALVAAILLAPAPDPPTSPASRIVFASARTGVAQLYSMEPSGAGLAQLTFGAGNWVDPVPSPDGRFVAAFRGPGWPPYSVRVPRPRPELWLMRADGSSPRLVSGDAEEAYWSSDSRRLVFFGDLGTSYGLATVAVAGGRPKLLPNIPYGTSPTPSPDGRSIAFFDPGWYVIVRRNGHERTVARNFKGRLFWSPNGRWIAIRDRDRLAVARASGGRVKVFPAAPSSCVDCGPPGVAWSPDSRRVAFETGDGIELATPAGARAKLLVQGLTRGLAWSPSGGEITFATSSGIGVATLDGRLGTLLSFRPGEAQPGIGWSPGRLALRYRTPEDTASGREVEAPSPIWRLSADGDRVAYWPCPHRFEVWRPGDAPVVLGSATDADCLAYDSEEWDPWDPAHNVGLLLLAGDRLAYFTRVGSMQASLQLWVTTLERGDEGVAIDGGSAASSDPPAVDNLVGGGSALVYGQRGPVLIHRHPESIWRVDGATPVEVASRPDDFVPLSVDAGRIVARRTDGSLDLLSLDGRVLETFDLPSLGAVLAGDDLVVLLQGELRDYSVASGELLHAWPLPDVRSSGRCRVIWCDGLTLDDAARGVVVYTLDGVVHLLRLSNDDDVALPGARVADLTEAGLFFAYVGDKPWQGRIRFVPFDQLPL
jgi:WD40-like Beta Propeller Repeat